VAGKIFTAIETSEIWIDPDHVGRVGIVPPLSSTYWDVMLSFRLPSRSPYVSRSVLAKSQVPVRLFWFEIPGKMAVSRRSV
jgi:hypothetical protein